MKKKKDIDEDDGAREKEEEEVEKKIRKKAKKEQKKTSSFMPSLELVNPPVMEQSVKRRGLSKKSTSNSSRIS
jgi:hypothetical protein